MQKNPFATRREVSGDATRVAAAVHCDVKPNGEWKRRERDGDSAAKEKVERLMRNSSADACEHTHTHSANARSARTKTARCSSPRFAKPEIMSRSLSWFCARCSLGSILAGVFGSVQFDSFRWLVSRANRERQSGNLRTRLNANPSKMERGKGRKSRL